MKLITSVGPNPDVVTTFMAMRGITDLPTEQIDIMSGANRQSDYLRKNPQGGSPCLELDDGSYLAEITAICEYLDEKAPGESLIGATAEERAETRMWVRRIDLGICETMANGFRYSEGLPMFKDRMVCVPEAADGLKAIARDRIMWLDGQLQGRQWICGDRFTLADIMLYCFLNFGAAVGQPLAEEATQVKALMARIGEKVGA